MDFEGHIPLENKHKNPCRNPRHISGGSFSNFGLLAVHLGPSFACVSECKLIFLDFFSARSCVHSAGQNWNQRDGTQMWNDHEVDAWTHVLPHGGHWLVSGRAGLQPGGQHQSASGGQPQQALCKTGPYCCAVDVVRLCFGWAERLC